MAVYRPVRALHRGLAVLKAVNTLARPTVEEIASALALPWATVFRLLETLEGAGYVRRSQSGRIWRPTLATRGLGEGYDRDAWVAEFAAGHIRKLSRRLVWPIDLMVPDRDTMLIVESTHRTSPLSLDRNMIGRRLPVLLTSAGRAYAAFLPPRERKQLVARLARTSGDEAKIARSKALMARLVRTTRSQGFGEREGGQYAHTRSIAVPIMADGVVAGCISIIWIASALTLDEGKAQFAAPLRTTAAAIAADVELHRAAGG